MPCWVSNSFLFQSFNKNNVKFTQIYQGYAVRSHMSICPIAPYAHRYRLTPCRSLPKFTLSLEKDINITTYPGLYPLLCAICWHWCMFTESVLHPEPVVINDKTETWEGSCSTEQGLCSVLMYSLLLWTERGDYSLLDKYWGFGMKSMKQTGSRQKIVCT